MTLFKEKYRIETTRLPGRDYAAGGAYFITICTQNKVCAFGRIVDKQIQLSPIGSIVADFWSKIPSVRRGVELDEWIVMPNHLHGIIIMERKVPVETTHGGVCLEASIRITRRGDMSAAHEKWKSGSLGVIVNQFKAACTKQIRKVGLGDFAWQERYYEHVIRDEESLGWIRGYIRNNTLYWTIDQEYVDS